MDIIKLAPWRELKSFYPAVYGADPLYKDNKLSLLPLVCGAGSSFYKNSEQEVIAVTDGGRRLCQCVLIRHSSAPDMANIAFFEALPGCHAAVDKLLHYAAQWGAARGCTALVAGMDGHLNYSLGLSLGHTAPPSFGEGYNPAYYPGYFGGFTEARLSCFEDPIGLVRERVNADCARVIARGKSGGLSFEQAAINRANLRRYTDLSNAIFAGHDFYYGRGYDEDYELFSQLRLILDPGALMFIKDGRTDIGLVFYYPDFNELVPPGRGFGVAEAIRRRVRFNPQKVKMAEIGVLPQYQSRGIISLAFGRAMDIATAHHPGLKTVISSWVVENNKRSMLFTQRYTKTVSNSFAVYEKDI